MRFKTFYEGLDDLPPDPEAKSTDKKPAAADKKAPAEDEVVPEKEAPKTLKDIFDDNKSALKTFLPKKVYDAKRVEDSVKAPLFPLTPSTPKGTYSTHDDDYIVRDHADIKKMWAVKNADFSKSFTPLNSLQKPDAEGFEKVRRSSKIDAFLYTDEEQKLANGTILATNTYLIRQAGSTSAPATIDKDKFEAEYETK